jgi:hypothetical protein
MFLASDPFASPKQCPITLSVRLQHGMARRLVTGIQYDDPPPSQIAAMCEHIRANRKDDYDAHPARVRDDRPGWERFPRGERVIRVRLGTPAALKISETDESRSVPHWRFFEDQ